ALCLGVPGILDVGAGADPADDGALRIAERHGAAEMPAVDAVGPPEPGLDRDRLSRPSARVPRGEDGGEIVGMHDRPPAPADALAECEPRVVAQLAVVEVERAVAAGGPDHLRHRVGDLPQLRLAMPEGMLDAAAPGDLGAERPDLLVDLERAIRD